MDDISSAGLAGLQHRESLIRAGYEVLIWGEPDIVGDLETELDGRRVTHHWRQLFPTYVPDGALVVEIVKGVTIGLISMILAEVIKRRFMNKKNVNIRIIHGPIQLDFTGTAEQVVVRLEESAKIDLDSLPFLCARCSAELSRGERFCWRCGTSIDWPT